MKKCPMCGQPAEWKDNANRPFCSERCKLLDFGGWINEQYTVPSDEAPLSEDQDQNVVTTEESKQ